MRLRGDDKYTDASGVLSLTLNCTLQGLVQSGFVLLVFLLRNLALLAFDFQLEKFFFQGLEQKSWPS